ncbi:MAG: hypothetical protein IPK80_02110 [Nannocystis sp.]|nr:hypothetical protein [Nannocystis sp.]
MAVKKKVKKKKVLAKKKKPVKRKPLAKKKSKRESSEPSPETAKIISNGYDENDEGFDKSVDDFADDDNDVYGILV